MCIKETIRKHSELRKAEFPNLKLTISTLRSLWPMDLLARYYTCGTNCQVSWNSHNFNVSLQLADNCCCKSTICFSLSFLHSTMDAPHYQTLSDNSLQTPPSLKFWKLKYFTACSWATGRPSSHQFKAIYICSLGPNPSQFLTYTWGSLTSGKTTRKWSRTLTTTVSQD